VKDKYEPVVHDVAQPLSEDVEHIIHKGEVGHGELDGVVGQGR